MSLAPIEVKDQEITKIGIESIIDFYRTMAIDQLHFPGLDVFATGIDSSSLNVVLDAKEDNEYNTNTVAIIADFFKNHHVPWGWFITAFSGNRNLEKNGFTLAYETPGMYFNLSAELPAIHSTIEIREACDDLKDWMEAEREGFPSSDNCEAWRKLNAGLLHKGKKTLRHFTAYFNGEAVSCGTLFLSSHSVMLHNLSTKNKFRNQGIGSALTVYMMNEAKKTGYKHCFLDSSDEGFNLYSRLGFKVYCVTSMYERSV